jgi:hypothetical protein
MSAVSRRTCVYVLAVSQAPVAAGGGLPGCVFLSSFEAFFSFGVSPGREGRSSQGPHSPIRAGCCKRDVGFLIGSWRLR